MPDPQEHRTPFVLGTPIKNPADFYGRKKILPELYDAILNHQLVTVVGEHRCGNTSVIYQLLHEEQRGRHLTVPQDEHLLFAFVSAQLASEGPNALLRRIALALRRADEAAPVDFTATIDRRWLEDYLEDLADRGRRLVLLIDEMEVLAGFPSSFWDWFQVLVTEYDVAIVATSRVDLGEFRSEHGVGPAFFNMFRSVYIGSFSPETVAQFLKEKAEITDFDFFAVADLIEQLAGRFPYYMQVAAALCYLHAAGDSRLPPEQVDTIRREFATRTRMLFDDAWPKLPPAERDALTWLLLEDRPGPDHEAAFNQAVQSLQRRGYVLDGRIFSVAFADFVRDKVRRIGLNTASGALRVERRLVQLPPKEVELLAFLLAHEGQVLTREEIEQAVWPEYADDRAGWSEAQLSDALARLQHAIGDREGDARHIEQLGSNTFRFQNAPFPGLEAVD